MRAELALSWLSCAALLVSGCDDASFSHLTYGKRVEQTGDAAPATRLGGKTITVVEGLAVAARVSAIGDDDDPMPVLRLRSLDPERVGVERGPVLGWFVFYGVAPGRAELDVLSDGRRVGRVAVTVEPQPSPEGDEP